MRFSQRMGQTPIKKLAQIENIDDDLKNSLWNLITMFYLDDVTFTDYSLSTKSSDRKRFIYGIWQGLFKEPIDQIPYKFSDTVKELKKRFYSIEWFEVFDIVEACSIYGPKTTKIPYIEACNDVLKTENSAYHFVNEQLCEITSQEEIDTVEEAISISGIYGGVQEHLKTALNHMNNRTNPDFRNSIKESISAVESLAKILSGKDKSTLGEALNALESKGVDLHGALKASFQSLYGYTSDSSGIRHALLEESTLTKTDAKFMLVSCSAFVNYLIALNDK